MAAAGGPHLAAALAPHQREDEGGTVFFSGFVPDLLDPPARRLRADRELTYDALFGACASGLLVLDDLGAG
jgi:hypothetical protein